jgi:hypothetical protein
MPATRRALSASCCPDRNRPRLLFASMPLTCPDRGADMRLIAFITAAAPVERVLLALGGPPHLALFAPARGPPARGEAPEPVPDLDCFGQPSRPWSLISASPGSRRRPRRRRCSPSRLPPARCAGDGRPSTPERHAPAPRDVRQPHSLALPAHPTPPSPHRLPGRRLPRQGPRCSVRFVGNQSVAASRQAHRSSQGSDSASIEVGACSFDLLR